MKQLQFYNDQVPNFSIVLSTRNHTHLGQLRNINYDSMTCGLHENSADELSFDVYKTLKGEKEINWDNIVDLKLVYIPELDEYFQIQVSNADGNNQVKTVTCTSQCEAELGQAPLNNIEINTEIDIERDNYILPTVFYKDISSMNPNSQEYKQAKNESFLHRILDGVPHYTIGHVDKSLWNLQRSFSIDGTNVYDFLTGDCANEFHCIFKFDAVNRVINVYDLYTRCNKCGYRGEYDDICPECGSDDLSIYGEDTTVYVDKDNLSDTVTFTTDVDSIKNCFRLEAGDDDMTAAIINLNPNGSRYIYYFSNEQKADMPTELVQKLDSYNKKYNSYTLEYTKIMKSIYNCIDWIQYYQSEMMPGVLDPNHRDQDSSSKGDISSVDKAEDQAKLLTMANLSPIALSKVSRSTSVATVNSALKNYAKVYVKSGYFKIEVDSGSTFIYSGTDSSGFNYGYWSGRFKVTNYSDENDVAYSSMLTNLKVYDNYEEFLNQKIMKQIASDNDEEGTIYDVFTNKNLDDFKKALTYYGLSRLTSFHDMCQTIIDILIEQGIETDDTESSLYNEFYKPYYDKLNACQDEISNRESQITEYQHTMDLNEERKGEIQADLDFEKYLGAELYKTFCAYRRVDTYSNENYISDGLNNTDLFKNAQEFLDTAKQELIRSGEYQHSISTSIYNLLTIKEFKPLLQHFKLGNWIRVGVEEKVYRLRLVTIQINFGSSQTIDVEFSNVTKTASGMNDIRSLLNSAQSMATSYTSVSRQSSKGNDANNKIVDMQKEGFDSALYNIFTDDNRSMTIDKHGLLGRTYDDIAEDYSGEQLRVTNNVIAFTTDNWKTLRAALGKQRYTLDGVSYEEYGVNADFCLSPKIIGGDIFSDNYSSSANNPLGTHINLRDGTFSLAGGKLKYDGNTLTLDGKISWDNITGTENIASKQNILDSEKRLNDSLTKSNTAITESLKDLKTSIGYTQIGKDYVISPKIIGGDISGTNISGNTITGNTINNGNGTFVVDKDGNLTASSANITGVINATGGTFGGNITATGTIKGGILSGCQYVSEGTVTYVKSQFTEADRERIKNIVLNKVTPTHDDYMKLDVNGDGTITIKDSMIINQLLSGQKDKYQYKRKILIDPANIGSISFFQDDILTSYYGVKGFNVENGTMDKLTAFGTVEFYGSVIEKNTSAMFTVASGGVYVRNMTATNSTVTSDKRLKNNISPITQKYINSIGEVDLIEYNYVPEIDTEEKLNFGVVAQDVIASLEKNNCTDKMGIVLTHKEKFDDYSTDYYGVNYNQFLLLRIAYDEQKISELTDRIKALETAISK
jgi:RNA polymerase subunit RPABC4/transcription elongation factor Spt4